MCYDFKNALMCVTNQPPVLPSENKFLSQKFDCNLVGFLLIKDKEPIDFVFGDAFSNRFSYEANSSQTITLQRYIKGFLKEENMLENQSLHVQLVMQLKGSPEMVQPIYKSVCHLGQRVRKEANQMGMFRALKSKEYIEDDELKDLDSPTKLPHVRERGYPNNYMSATLFLNQSTYKTELVNTRELQGQLMELKAKGKRGQIPKDATQMSQEANRITLHNHQQDLQGKKPEFSTLNFINFGFSYFLGKMDLRSNPFQVGEDDMILTWTRSMEQPEEIEDDELMDWKKIESGQAQEIEDDELKDKKNHTDQQLKMSPASQNRARILPKSRLHQIRDPNPTIPPYFSSFITNPLFQVSRR